MQNYQTLMMHYRAHSMVVKLYDVNMNLMTGACKINELIDAFEFDANPKINVELQSWQVAMFFLILLS